MTTVAMTYVAADDPGLANLKPDELACSHGD
jgi:hypothetical protein